MHKILRIILSLCKIRFEKNCKMSSDVWDISGYDCNVGTPALWDLNFIKSTRYDEDELIVTCIFVNHISCCFQVVPLRSSVLSYHSQ